MKNVLVTGCKGQLGSELQKFIVQDPNLNYIFTERSTVDITNIENVQDYIAQNHIDIIVNCAAYTNVEKAEDERDVAYKVNVTGAKILAESCKKFSVLLLHISTDALFDGKKSSPYLETDFPSPLSVYSHTKYLGELEILKLEIDSLIIRTSWLYSEYGNNFVKTIYNKGKQLPELRVIFDQVGSPTYSYNLASAIHFILSTSQDKIVKTEIYNYSNLGVCSWYDFATQIKTIASLPCLVSPIESHEYSSKVIRPHYSVLNTKKIRQKFEIKIPYWRDALSDCLQKIKSIDMLG